jgi:hypothetical protein
MKDGAVKNQSNMHIVPQVVPPSWLHPRTFEYYITYMEKAVKEIVSL